MPVISYRFFRDSFFALKTFKLSHRSQKRKNKITPTYKVLTMEIFYLPGEETFLTFKNGNGSGWLTSHRLILCEHPSGQLEGHTPDGAREKLETK
jgi:hypothetical protein